VDKHGNVKPLKKVPKQGGKYKGPKKKRRADDDE